MLHGSGLYYTFIFIYSFPRGKVTKAMHDLALSGRPRGGGEGRKETLFVWPSGAARENSERPGSIENRRAQEPTCDYGETSSIRRRGELMLTSFPLRPLDLTRSPGSVRGVARQARIRDGHTGVRASSSSCRQVSGLVACFFFFPGSFCSL